MHSGSLLEQGTVFAERKTFRRSGIALNILRPQRSGFAHMIIRQSPFAACLFSGLLALGAASGSAQEQPKPEPKAHLLRQILIADSVEAAQALTFVPNGEFIVISSPTYAAIDRTEFLKRLQAGQNRAINDKLLAAIAQVVENFIRQSGFAVATAIIPPQNIANGEVRVAVLPGKIRNIKFEGNRWFSESLLKEKMHIERGEAVRITELDRAITWTNASQFRRVRLHVEPVPETGEADLIVGVQDRLPLRVTAGYENTGNAILGYDRYSGSLTYGNLWGLDHQLSYQQAFSQSTKLFRVHAFEYRAPLRWRHMISVSGSYAEVNPTFYGGLFTQKGKSLNADAKYVVPFHLKQWEGELTSAIGFKESNNNLEFGGAPALGTTNDIFTASVSAAGVRQDQRGRWIVSATLTGSPGEMNSRSTAANYNESRIGARPQFVVGQFLVQRLTALTPSLTSIARVSAQLAGTNLVPSEQFAAGGASSVRGYEERFLSGDGGYLATHELQRTLPPLSLGKRLPKLETAAAVFWDYGRTIIKHPLIGEPKSAHLASVGIGLRFSIANNLSATADLARQLAENETPGAPHHRLHVKLTLAY
jgi:hemolysin activation/secretion protein